MPPVQGIDPRLLTTLVALGDYLQDVVLVGGWVPHLYRRLWPSESPVEARRTFDLDAAVRGPLPVRRRSRLDVLLAAEGYKPMLGGANGLAAQIYQSPANSDLLPIEFLAPLTGPREETTVEIQQGVTAQALRYLNILLENTLEVRVSTEAPAGSRDELTVRIPIPGAYVFHRGFIHPGGTSRRRGKDLYYIFETWASLPDLRERIVTEIAQMRSRYPRAWYRRFRSNLENLFSSPAAAGVLLVFEQYEAGEPRTLRTSESTRRFVASLTPYPTNRRPTIDARADARRCAQADPRLQALFPDKMLQRHPPALATLASDPAPAALLELHRHRLALLHAELRGRVRALEDAVLSLLLHPVLRHPAALACTRGAPDPPRPLTVPRLPPQPLTLAHGQGSCVRGLIRLSGPIPLWHGRNPALSPGPRRPPDPRAAPPRRPWPR